MKKNRLAQTLKEIRGNETQEQLAMALNVSRESVSKYENGHVKVPPDVSRMLMNRYDEPRFALILRNEYTETGAVWLDGPNADLHRSAVKEKALDDLQKLSVTLQAVSYSKPLETLASFDKPQIEALLFQTIETIQTLEILAVITSEQAGIHYTDSWRRHYKKLKAKGLTKS